VFLGFLWGRGHLSCRYVEAGNGGSDGSWDDTQYQYHLVFSQLTPTKYQAKKKVYVSSSAHIPSVQTAW
jgi:hypothetical protein